MIKGRTKLTLQEKLWCDRGWYPCPGFIGDPDNDKRKFDRWHKRPQAAWRLYWKARPEKYAKMLEYNLRRRKKS